MKWIKIIHSALNTLLAVIGNAAIFTMVRRTAVQDEQVRATEEQILKDMTKGKKERLWPVSEKR